MKDRCVLRGLSLERTVQPPLQPFQQTAVLSAYGMAKR